MDQWVVHRDSRWYTDPLVFNPERWTKEFKHSLSKLAYFRSARPRSEMYPSRKISSNDDIYGYPCVSVVRIYRLLC